MLVKQVITKTDSMDLWMLFVASWGEQMLLVNMSLEERLVECTQILLLNS